MGFHSHSCIQVGKGNAPVGFVTARAAGSEDAQSDQLSYERMRGMLEEDG